MIAQSSSQYFCKKFFVCLVLLNSVLYIPCTLTNPDKHTRIFRHKAIPTLDGMPNALDGKFVANSFFIMQRIYKLLYGTKDPETNQRVGIYLLNGEYYSIHQLVRKEAHAQSEDEKKSLHDLLQIVKEDFVGIVNYFIEDARGARTIIDEITKEWAHLRHRPNTFLLTWGKQEEGHELEYFFREVNSFEKLDEFCNDLLSFLDDLIASCPTGMKQYQELKEKNKKTPHR